MTNKNCDDERDLTNDDDNEENNDDDYNTWHHSVTNFGIICIVGLSTYVQIMPEYVILMCDCWCDWESYG